VERPRWANEVVDFRDEIWINPQSPQSKVQEMHERIVVLEQIIEYIEPAWRYPRAVYFAALIGPDSEIADPGPNDNPFLLFFEPYYFLSP
jgi:hypothetical protein